MREIKFRAWHDTAMEMLREDLPGDVFRWYNEGQPVTIEQFTGLRDKNGKEIYDGDIVRVSHGGRHYWLFEIKSLGGQFGNNIYGVCFEHNLSSDEESNTYTYEKVTGSFYRSECMGGKDSEVIGNIHENPELLA